MSNYYSAQPIFNLKLSELVRMQVTEKRTLKVTGKLDRSNKHPLLFYSSNREIVLYASKNDDTCKVAANRFLLENNFEFNDDSNHPGSDCFETLVDISLLDDFNVVDINPAHDLVQFIGYKDSNSTLSVCRFKAIFFRVISRANLANYYAALDVQYEFIIDSSKD